MGYIRRRDICIGKELEIFERKYEQEDMQIGLTWKLNQGTEGDAYGLFFQAKYPRLYLSSGLHLVIFNERLPSIPFINVLI